LLPERPSGFYKEFTVPTPGEDDRGARRIVTGDDDRILYYTDDHYQSFRRIRP
jgi:ribonuclease T1